MINKPLKQLLTIKDLARQFQITEGTIRKWVMNNKIPFIKLGKAVRFDQNKIDTWINARSVKTRIAGMTV
jgi:excisionase family DNA binding protein